ncbi:hypothetical protein CHARACLAT_017991 [Characodon lateralis]|uniref:Uncharacterized protein n=1 Tax=Characodon lateralis TaxID=208331 RepID=A0ABU7E1S1_9TELE|nr:hypothetical protein [Characodon lateralis]
MLGRKRPGSTQISLVVDRLTADSQSAGLHSGAVRQHLMCGEGGRGHETVITVSILLLKKDPTVIPSLAHSRGDEEDRDV